MGWCCMCLCSRETDDHLLLYCDVASRLWSRLFKVIGVQRAGMIAALLFRWWNSLGKHSSEIWNLVPLCLKWTLWQECHSCTFEDTERSWADLESAFFWTLYDWSRAWGLTHSHSILDFILSLNTCA